MDRGSAWVKIAPFSNVNALGMNNKTLFVGNRGAAAFRSTDGGTNWESASSGIAYSAVYAFALMGNTLFAGTGRGIYRSDDNGANWMISNSGLLDTNVCAFGVYKNTIFTGTEWGGYTSVDTGLNWTSSSKGVVAVSVVSLAKKGITLLAGTYNHGLFSSEGSSGKWRSVTSGLKSNYDIVRMSVVNDAVFAVSRSTGLYRSVDDGKSWTFVDSIFYKKALWCVAGIGEVVYAGGTEGLFFSTDSGSKWKKNDSGLFDSPNVLSILMKKITHL